MDACLEALKLLCKATTEEGTTDTRENEEGGEEEEGASTTSLEAIATRSEADIRARRLLDERDGAGAGVGGGGSRLEEGSTSSGAVLVRTPRY